MRISDWSSDVCSSDLLDRLGRVLVLHSQVEPFLLRQAVEDQAADRLALLQAGTAVGHLAQQLPAQAGVDRAFEDAELVVEVLLDVLDLALFDLLGTLVLLDAVAGEDLDRSEEHTSELQSLMRISYAVFCLKTKTITEN